MKALEIEVDIAPDGQVLNARLPSSCRPWFGNHAKLIMILPDIQCDNARRQVRLETWRALLKETQALPQAQKMTEEIIDAEIEAYRSGR
jgi:hypothetical protein